MLGQLAISSAQQPGRGATTTGLLMPLGPILLEKAGRKPSDIESE